jgi:hypothetical protein
MLRHYRASINIDFTKHKSNQYSKLVVALIDNGWLWVETSALIMDTTDLAKIWRGVELVAKQCEKAGQLSAFTFHIQGSDNFSGKHHSAKKLWKDPTAQILALPWPKPQT